MKYIIYKNKKSPTQSGEQQKIFWILEALVSVDVQEDLLTGWKAKDAKQINKLKFKTENEIF